jgi:ABC-2 type transport system ATP-binding protein
VAAHPSDEAAIEIDGLRKSYSRLRPSGRRKPEPSDDVTWAVRGLSLQVRRGEIFAFLGPNGAGKTTTVEILEGFRRRDGGDVRVLGVDPEHGDRSWRARIGIVLQEGRAQHELTVRETLELWAAYYPRPKPVAETIALVGLVDKADDRVGRLSGGQRRRLDVGLALAGDPDLIFLDEPTTGFDPVARRAAWSVIAGLRDLGKTVFLTTHYLDEAQALADRVAIIKAGVIVAEGPPQSLGAGSTATTEITFVPPAGVDMRELPGGPAIDVGSDGIARIRTDLPTRVLAELCGWAMGRGGELERLEVTRPTLEDVYLELVQSDPGEPDAAPAPARAGRT